MKKTSLAAQRLAEAARTLSAASQALAEAAAVLSASSGLSVTSEENGEPGKSEDMSISSKSSKDGETTGRNLSNIRENVVIAKARNVELDYPSSDEESMVKPILPSKNPVGITSHVTSPPIIATKRPELVQNTPQRPRYHVLLANEADVLLAMSQIAQKHSRAVCYLAACTVPAIPLYQKLLEIATDTNVLTITKTSLEEIAAKLELFRNTSRGILLLPENVCPDLVFKSNDSCVIHMGWPSNREQYELQVQTHNAACSTLIAFAEDKSLYPAGAEIVSRTHPGNARYPFLLKEIDQFRPHFRSKLAEIPVIMKERIYPEWIAIHGPKGRRRVESWSPTTLVYRANLYLLDVLQYAGDPSTRNTVDGSLQVGLPHVSAGFISHNGLQSAVDDRVLNVQPGSLSTVANSNPLDVISLSDLGGVRPPSTSSASTSSKPLPPPLPSQPFQPQSTRTYIVLDNDFDIFPYIIHLFSSRASRKVICFIKEIGVVSYLTEQLNEALTVPALVASAQSASKLQQAAEEFNSANGALLFWSAYTVPHSILRAGRVDLVVHLGWAGDPVLRKQQEELSRASTIVLTRTEFSHMNDGRQLLKDAGLVGSQEATPLNMQGPGSQLDKARKAWRAYLAAAPTRSLRNSYMQWITHYFHGGHKVEGWDSIKVASEANQFARKILLRGSGSNNNSADGLVGGQLAVTPGLAKHLGLEDAVRAGLLTVEA
ncbi:hypothetical protein BDV93DRAFT_524893 [Ceratobasidium sp. AG-I]|nr:hypothetical protein BDV93DRAFT_524893 [Ceratobasidium sp. AG-I]